MVMKRPSFFFYILSLALLVGCEPGHMSQELKDAIRQRSLAQFVQAVYTHNNEIPASNPAQLQSWLQAYATSTNFPAAQVRRQADEVWVAGSPEEWEAALDPKSPRGKTLMIAKYREGTNTHQVELGMDGELRPSTNGPHAGFFRLNLGKQ